MLAPARIATLACAVWWSFFFMPIDSGVNAQEEDPNSWHAVQVKCPIDHDGLLEIRNRNRVGQIQVLRVVYRNNTAISVWATRADTPDFPPSSPRLSSESKPERMFAQIILRAAEGPLKHYCLSDPDERKAAMAELEANRRKLGP